MWPQHYVTNNMVVAFVTSEEDQNIPVKGGTFQRTSATQFSMFGLIVINLIVLVLGRIIVLLATFQHFPHC